MQQFALVSAAFHGSDDTILLTFNHSKNLYQQHLTPDQLTLRQWDPEGKLPQQMQGNIFNVLYDGFCMDENQKLYQYSPNELQLI